LPKPTSGQFANLKPQQLLVKINKIIILIKIPSDPHTFPNKLTEMFIILLITLQDLHTILGLMYGLQLPLESLALQLFPDILISGNLPKDIVRHLVQTSQVFAILRITLIVFSFLVIIATPLFEPSAAASGSIVIIAVTPSAIIIPAPAPASTLVIHIF
jgi:hypothetical protein